MQPNVNGLVVTIRDIAGRYTANLTPNEKAQYIATIIGTSIGASIDMPSTPVDIPRNYFLVNHSERVSRILGLINEQYPINFDLALSVTDNVFLARYRLVFEPAFTVHMLGHLSACSDDVVPTAIRDILNKVDTEDADLAVSTRILCHAIGEL